MKITIEIDSVLEYQISRLLDSITSPVSETEPDAPEKPKRGRKPKKTKDEIPADEPQFEAEDAPQGSQEAPKPKKASNSGYDQEGIRNLILESAGKIGVKAVAKILKTVADAKKASDIPEEKYQDVADAIQAAVNAKDEDTEDIGS